MCYCDHRGKSIKMAAVFRFLFLFFSLVYAASPPTSPEEKRRGRKFNQLVAGDPRGEKDSFAELSATDQSYWGLDTSKSLAEMRKEVQNLEMPIRIDIKLVGFDGEGMEGVSLSSSQLVWQLRSLKPEVSMLALHRLNAELWGEVDLGVTAKVIYQVSKTRQALCADIESQIAQAVRREQSNQQNSGGNLVHISHTIVDNILSQEYTRSGAMRTIYILNPKMPGTRYIYMYNTREACPGTLWAGSNQRYVWIDLTAGPVSYGPSEAGQGRVLSHSIPRVEHYNDAWRNKALVPDLAALAHSASKHLMTPASVNLYQKDWMVMDIQIIHIHDTMNPGKAVKEMTQYDEMVKELQPVLLPGQSVHIIHYHVGFGHCDVCVAAYSRAMRSRTERLPGAGMHISTSPYLDSEVLYAWLSDEDFQDELTDNNGLTIPLTTAPPHRILPVFIFEISSFDTLIMDDRGAAESFPDMVVAVRSHGGGTSSGFTCSDKRLQMETSNIYRPLLAAVLTSGWGVMDTAQSVSTSNQDVQMDYTWSVGNTIYGYLSSTSTLSFSQSDAAIRNTILAKVHSLTLQTDAILRGFQNMSSTGYIYDALPAKNQIRTFFQRMDVLTFKLEACVRRLGLMGVHDAWYFARSAKHDISELYKLAQASAEGSTSRVECPEKQGELKFWLVAVVGLVLGVFFGLLRRFRPKKKKTF